MGLPVLVPTPGALSSKNMKGVTGIKIHDGNFCCRNTGERDGVRRIFENPAVFHPALKKLEHEETDMDETITIKIPKGQRSRMIAEAKREMCKSLAGLDPPFNDELDKVKLHGCSTIRGGLEVVYRVMRGASRGADPGARSVERGR
jgi:hypothetical protein